MQRNKVTCRDLIRTLVWPNETARDFHATALLHPKDAVVLVTMAHSTSTTPMFQPHYKILSTYMESFYEVS